MVVVRLIALMFLDRSDKGSLGCHLPHLLVPLLQLVPDLVPDGVLLLAGDGVPVVPHHVVLDGLLVPLKAVLTERSLLSSDLARCGPGICQLISMNIVLHLFPGSQPGSRIQFYN